MPTLRGTGRHTGAQSAVGRTLGNWRMSAVIGEGSFGVVYEAHNVSIAGRRAAVKVLHPHMSTQLAIQQRFLNEASAASRAEHENIVQVFDGGITPDGYCYSVMELLKGHTLAEVIASGPLDGARLLAIAEQAASALEAAHAIEIVHRDLKPDNLFITQRASNAEFVKVLDFGVCKLRGGIDNANATLSGQLVGTPGYMSPEQWMTMPDIDGRADIYSLGIILYEGLTGQLPFDEMTAYDWQQAHLTRPLPDLRLRGVAPEMAQLVERFAAKAREDRPATMQEAIAAMREVREALFPPGAALPRARIAPQSRVALPLDGAATILTSERPSDPAGEVEELVPPRRSGALIGVGALVAVALGCALYWGVTHSSTSAPDEHASADAVKTPPAATVTLPDELVAFGPGDLDEGWTSTPDRVDSPAHRVHVGRFALGKYEVSMDEYKKYIEAQKVTGELPWDGVDDFASVRDLPVDAVTADAAARFCAWRYPALGGRLPTEEEWEFAARDGKPERRFPWAGDRFDSSRANAGPRGKHAALVAVDALPAGATEKGIVNLIGNVAEWTSTRGARYPGGSAAVPAGTLVVRGGSANSTVSEDLTATARKFAKPETRDPFIGFRCAVSRN